MGVVNVTIEDITGNKFRAQLPDNIVLGRLLPLLLMKLNYPLTDSSEQPLFYRLLHQRARKQLQDNNTLQQAHVRDNDLIKLVGELKVLDIFYPPDNEGQPRQKEPSEELKIDVEPYSNDLISLNPLSTAITQAKLQSVWQLAIERTAGLDEQLKATLRTLGHALSWNEDTVELFVDDDMLWEALQNSTQYEANITAALSEVLGVEVPFHTTELLIIEIPTGDQELSVIPNDIDSMALNFFQETGQFLLLKPDKGVYELPVDEEALELHWFQVRRNVSMNATQHEYLDVFCVSTLNRLPRQLRLEVRYPGLSWQPFLHQYSELLALTGVSFKHIAQQILAHLSQEIIPISPNKFFLFVPLLPEAGIHLVTGPFDLALEGERATPIPFDVPLLEEAQSRSSSTEILNDELHYWYNRVNRYHRHDPVMGRDYYRHDDLEARIRACIEQGQPFGLFVPRRMGKSSILLEMKRKGTFGHACVSITNMQEYLWRSLWSVFAEAMNDWLEQLGTPLTEAFSLSRKRLVLGLQDEELIKEEVQRLIHLLPERVPLVLILDEIGELLPQPPDYQKGAFPDWREFLAFLRVLFYSSDRRFILGVAGYGSDIAHNAFGDENRNPWLRQIKPILIRPLTRSDCDRMIQDIGAMTEIYYAPESLSLLYEYTSGHPQITRELCAALSEQTKSRPLMVQSEDVDRVIEEYLADNATIRAMYQGLSAKEQAMLLHLAGETSPTVKQLYQALKPEFTNRFDFDETLGRMMQHGFIQKEETTHSLHLRFGLFRKYLLSLI